MQAAVVLRQVGALLALLGLSMGLVIPVAWLVGEPGNGMSMAFSAAITLGMGSALFLGFRRRAGSSVTRRDAFAIVTLAWVLTGAFGSLPYLWTGATTHPAAAFFESVSGFTTTGSSIFPDPGSLPRTILFWRSLTQWLGGMGIIVLFVAVFAELGVGGRFLFQSEVPGPINDSVKPRIRDASLTLWKIYMALTLAETGALLLSGLDLFDAVNHALTTMSTGGFSTRTESLAAFGPGVQWIVVFFMALAGVNFSLYQVTLQGRPGVLWRDREFQVYLGLLVGASGMLSLDLWANGRGLAEAIRVGVFQVTSLTTTTGYVTDDFNQYSSFGRILLVSLMFVGGCAGSTAGGIKVVRLAILFKVLHRGIIQMVRPQLVRPIRLGNRLIPESAVQETSGFFFLYMAVFLGASLFVAAHGLDPATTLSAVAATLGNIGPGLEQVGAVAHYGDLPASVQVVLSGCMILGRLELLTVLSLFSPVFWRW